jgi:hypothetical protein
MRLVKPSDEDCLYIIERLKEKTNIFDYQTEEGFIENLRKKYGLIFESEFSWYFCNIHRWPTGLTTMNIEQVSRPGKSGGIKHMHKHLPEIEVYAKFIGVDRILLEGRRGIERIFPNYKTQSTTLWRDV